MPGPERLLLFFVMQDLKVALVHDWLTGMRGGERCLEAFCELFPDADIYTLLHIKGSVSRTIERHRITTSFIQSFPLVERYYRYYLPVFPFAIERFRLQSYDLVLSSSHCVAKGIRPPAGAKHLCYIHSPMRYVWDQFDNYAQGGRSGAMARLGMELFRARLQAWDVASAVRVDQFVANSHNIAAKVQRYYNRPASVLHPPVDWQTFQAAEKSENFYLMVTAFAPYKRVDLAIQACNAMKRRLKIIGKGQEETEVAKACWPDGRVSWLAAGRSGEGPLRALPSADLPWRGRFWYRSPGSHGLWQARDCLWTWRGVGDRGAVARRPSSTHGTCERGRVLSRMRRLSSRGCFFSNSLWHPSLRQWRGLSTVERRSIHRPFEPTSPALIGYGSRNG